MAKVKLKPGLSAFKSKALSLPFWSNFRHLEQGEKGVGEGMVSPAWNPLPDRRKLYPCIRHSMAITHKTSPLSPGVFMAELFSTTRATGTSLPHQDPVDFSSSSSLFFTCSRYTGIFPCSSDLPSSFQFLGFASTVLPLGFYMLGSFLSISLRS